MVGRTGFEPVTNWLKVNCSTNWANDPLYEDVLHNAIYSTDGRSRGIRTPDILLPKQARYQTALYSDGSSNWTRTSDPMINSHLLYQLSYRGINQESTDYK